MSVITGGHIGGKSGDHNGAVMTMTEMTGSIMAGTATVCNGFTYSAYLASAD